jgi:hypothetical protein
MHFFVYVKQKNMTCTSLKYDMHFYVCCASKYVMHFSGFLLLFYVMSLYMFACTRKDDEIAISFYVLFFVFGKKLSYTQKPTCNVACKLA